ncbi:hypothetical protein SAMN00808754_2168 [Thermanaeromonas toyohensis ToBE]|uniref:Uncharacterized protein n=1 Tax=Thermanaeromonas toyohensis ToBE TaxID=698762 RepID=A0A1W1VXR7_9FIRM|nr:hypothetical protein [Thermanaeromonas toyohensis]SMB98167.1 hypothetical protein SAMN00808754_2168 [Thermanaeromonas toyohensis ToBE]
MTICLCPELTRELSAVQQHLEREKGRVTWPALSRLDWEFLPAMVIISGQFYRFQGPRLISLAAVFQFIFLASFIHTSAGKEAARPTLWGDYFYTKFFELLCRDGNLEFLPTLANMICQIHLLLIKMREAQEAKDTDEIIREVRALLGGNAAKLGALLGGADLEEASLWYEVGRTLGAIWWERSAGQSVPTVLLREAEATLKRIPDNPERSRAWEIFRAMCAPMEARKLAT